MPPATDETKAFHTNSSPATTTVKSLPHFLSRTSLASHCLRLNSGSKLDTNTAPSTVTKSTITTEALPATKLPTRDSTRTHPLHNPTRHKFRHGNRNETSDTGDETGRLTNTPWTAFNVCSACKACCNEAASKSFYTTEPPISPGQTT